MDPKYPHSRLTTTRCSRERRSALLQALLSLTWLSLLHQDRGAGEEGEEVGVEEEVVEGEVVGEEEVEEEGVEQEEEEGVEEGARKRKCLSAEEERRNHVICIESKLVI